MRIEIITFFVVYCLVAVIHHENWQQLVFHAGGLAVCSVIIIKTAKSFYYDYVCTKIAKKLLASDKLTYQQKAFCRSVILSLNNNHLTYQRLLGLEGKKEQKHSTNFNKIIIYIAMFLLAITIYFAIFLTIAVCYF